MLDPVAKALHLSRTSFDVLVGVGLLILSVAIGLALDLIFRRSAKRHPNTWTELVLSLLQSLSLPLLTLIGLYTVLEVLTLPRRYEVIGAELIKTLVVIVSYFFPAKVITLFLRRTGEHKPEMGSLTQFAAFVTRIGFLLLALYTLQEVLNLPARYEHFGSKLVGALGITIVFYALAKVVILYLRRLSREDPALSRLTEPAVFIARLLFALLATIVVLDNLGIHLTAVWTTLGVGSVAVALALQDTLGNFFAGIYLLVDRPIGPGDYIRLDSTQEGYVVRIGWRSTQLRTLANNMIIVPNSTLSKAIITNYSLPEDRMSLGIPVSVAYGTDPNRLNKALIEVAEAAAQDGLEGLLADPKPFVRFIPGFGASSLDFTLTVQVRKFVDQYLVQSELRKRILDRLEQEAIAMPFPTTTIVLDKSAGSAWGGAGKEPEEASRLDGEVEALRRKPGRNPLPGKQAGN